MTTDTPSVDEARRAYESAVQHAHAVALDNMDREDGDRHDEAECRALVGSRFARLRGAIVADTAKQRDEAQAAYSEAILERDEAIGLLREFAQADRVITSAGLGAGTYKRHMHPVLRDAAAFLARFPEGGEG